MSLFNELKRRNVLRVGAAYVVFAWLVIQVIETIFPAFGFGDGAIRIATIVFAIGLIPTLIFAWAFELTPEGLKKESEVDRTRSLTPHTGKKLDRMIMVVLALALGYFAFDKFVLNLQREAELREQTTEQLATATEQARQEGRTEALVESYGDKSIAVLPFVNMSSDVEQEFFSDGISEELLNLLARIPDLRVISRSSAFSYKGKDIKLAQVAEELNVAHILEGSVRKAGNTIRITAQLIEARSDTHLWSETFDRKLDDIFAIQDEISAAVVEKLKITLLGNAPQVQETDQRVYEAFLLGQSLLRERSVQPILEAQKVLEEALVIDPDYAPAMGQLALAYFLAPDYGAENDDTTENYVAARPLIEQAIDLAPMDPINLGIYGLVLKYSGEPQLAVEKFEQALAINPTITDARYWFGGLLYEMGDFQGSREQAIQAYRTDPRSVQALHRYIIMKVEYREFEGLDAILERFDRISPENAARARFYVLTAQGDFSGNLISLVKGLQHEPDSPLLRWFLSLGLIWIGFDVDAVESIWPYERESLDVAAFDAEARLVRAEERRSEATNDVQSEAAYLWAVLDAAEGSDLDPGLGAAIDKLIADSDPVTARRARLPLMKAWFAYTQGDFEGARAAAIQAAKPYQAAYNAGIHDLWGIWKLSLLSYLMAPADPSDALHFYREVLAISTMLRENTELGFRHFGWGDLPSFQKVREEHNALLASERIRVLKMVCPLGDESPWQPGTALCSSVMNN